MKTYLKPKIEVFPVVSVTALCVSGDSNSFTTNPTPDSQALGRAPRRTPVF